MLFQNSIGIDIRDRRISIVHLKGSLKGIQLAGYDTQLIDASVDADKRLLETQKAIEFFIAHNNINDAEIFISVHSALAIQRVVEVPSAIGDDFLQSISYELEKYVPIPKEDIYFDAQIIEEIKEKNRLKILLLVIKKGDLEPFIKLGKKIGKGIGGIEISATAISNFLLYHAEIANKKPFIHIVEENGTGEIVFLKNGKLHFFQTFTGIDNEEDKCILVGKTIQKLKERFGIGDDPLYIGEDQENSKGMSQNSFPGIESMTINTAKIPTTGFPIGEYAAAFGIALKGLKKTPVSYNLLPQELRKKPSRFGFYMMIVLSIMVILTGFTWIGSHALKTKIEMSRIDDSIVNLKKEVAEIAVIESEIDEISTKIDKLIGVQQKYVPALNILEEMTEKIPETAWLDEFSYSNGSIQITGKADDASKILSFLEESTIFENVVFLTAITKNKEGKENFRIRINIKNEFNKTNNDTNQTR